MIFTGNDVSLIANFKVVMKSEFEMTDLGLLIYFLGIEVKQIEKGIFISQVKYVEEVVRGSICRTTSLHQLGLAWG